MENIDRRKYPRVEVRSSISYVCVDKDGNLVDQHMGVALNISQTGALLETRRLLESTFISLMFVDLEEMLVEISGEIVYCRENDSSMYLNGIRFLGTYEENVQFTTKLIRAYHYRKSDFLLMIGVNA